MGCVLYPGSNDNIWRTLVRIINKKMLKMVYAGELL